LDEFDIFAGKGSVKWLSCQDHQC